MPGPIGYAALLMEALKLAQGIAQAIGDGEEPTQADIDRVRQRVQNANDLWEQRTNPPQET